MDASFSEIKPSKKNKAELKPNLLSHMGEALIRRWSRHIEFGELIIDFPSGDRHVAQGTKAGSKADLRINSLGMMKRLLSSGHTGFAEAYMAGEWETSDLPALLAFGHLNMHGLSDPLGKHWIVRFLERLRHAGRANTKDGSRRNIAAHYDLGNDFFTQWLDPSMSYSSGLFEDVTESLEDAQRRKYLRLCQVLDLQEGDRVLELGCGWGGFAEIAAREFGCHVVGLTLSQEQATFARQHIERLGLTDKVEIRVQDYRDCGGTFDKITSIEMFEAVGRRYWPVYLGAVKRLLKPGGKAALQIITIEESSYDSYRRDPDFIQRYIFPGGMLPSPSALSNAVRSASLKISDAFYFAPSYAETLRRWDYNFCANWPEIENQGFDQKFFRMWHYYLCYCTVGFDHSAIDVGQFVIEHE